MKIIYNSSTKESKKFTTAVVKWHQSLTTLLCALSCICYSRKIARIMPSYLFIFSLYFSTSNRMSSLRQLKIVCGLMNELRFSFIFTFFYYFVHKSECVLFTTRELFLMQNGYKRRSKETVMYGNGTLVMKIIIFYTKKDSSYKSNNEVKWMNEWMDKWQTKKARKQEKNLH